MTKTMRVAIIGGGAAGFFAAISAKEHHPSADVFILEKTTKLLSKVKISGGGRCNVTNGCTDVNTLLKAYPRGGKKLKSSFHRFNTSHTMQWFESRGVALVIQEDGCVFPVSQDSQSIIDCFLQETHRLGISIFKDKGVKSIKQENGKFQLSYIKAHNEDETYDKVIIATGGSPKMKGLDWLAELGHKIESPVPSLFTFNMPDESVKSLMGIVVENVKVRIQGEKLIGDGPLLITHWGMSGPAILKLSAFGARLLSEKNYEFSILVNWVDERNNEAILAHLKDLCATHNKKLVQNIRPYFLPERLWHYLMEKCNISSESRWSDLGNKSLNKIVSILSNDEYKVRGKTTFKEEFVTCGGVSLKSIDLKTMQSKVVPNLYFAGEVMDIDAITGGYNFQGAWTTAYIAGILEN